MGGYVEKFEGWQQKMADDKAFKKREKERKFEAAYKRATTTAVTSPPNSDAYRDGWERIFGNKSRNEVPDESPEVAE